MPKRPTIRFECEKQILHKYATSQMRLRLPALLFAFHAILAAGAPPIASAEELTPERASQICQATYRALHRDHLCAAPMPSDLERAVVDVYLRSLDPRKMHFRAEDVDAFRRQAKGLERQLSQGELSLMHEVLRVYRVRVRQSHEVAMRMADRPHDFRIDELIDLDFRHQPYCVSVVEHYDRWRKWTKYELLRGLLPGETRDQRRTRLKRRYDRFLKAVLDADREEQLEDFLTALAKALDPHSRFLSPRTLENFNT